MSARGHHGLLLAGGLGDPFWSYVTSLLPCTGPAGSATFADAKGFNWGVNGDVKVSDVQSLFGENMAYFDGAGDYLLGAAGAFNYHGQDFTWEAFLNTTQTTNNCVVSGRAGTRAGWELFAPAGQALDLAIWDGTRYLDVFGTLLLPSGTTVHVSVGYASGKYYLSINGAVDVVESAIIPGTYPTFQAVLGSDLSGPSQYPYAGYLGQQRMTLGICRYTSDFTPPDAPFPAHG